MELDFLDRYYNIDTGAAVLRFQQCTAWECFEVLDNIQQNELYIYEFLKEFFEKYCISDENDFESIDFLMLWKELSKTYFGGFFSGEGNGDRSQNAPFSSIIQILGEKTGQDPYELLKKWSYTQLMEWMDGLSWNMREQSEEGRKQNDKWRHEHKDHEFMRKKVQDIDDIFDNLEENIKSGKVKVTSETKVSS